MAYNCWDTKWKRGFWRGIEIIGFTAGVALIPFSIFIWLNIWLWPNFMHDLIREIPESWIEDVSEWQGPFTFNSEQNFPLQIEVAIMEATGKETISGVKYEKRTGKATTRHIWSSLRKSGLFRIETTKASIPRNAGLCTHNPKPPARYFPSSY